MTSQVECYFLSAIRKVHDTEISLNHKETSFFKDINIRQFLVDLRCIYFSLSGILFVYPLIAAVSHSKPGWVLNTKKGLKSIKMSAW